MLRGLYGWPDFLPEDGEGSAIDWIFMGTPGQGTAVHVRALLGTWPAPLDSMIVLEIMERLWTTMPIFSRFVFSGRPSLQL